MFASEKVMLDYLSQLLTEEDVSEVEESEQIAATETKDDVAEQTFIAKKTETIQTSAVNRERPSIIKTEPKLQPISSKVNQLRDFKEDVVTLSEPSSVEKLLQQVELKQQEKTAVETKVTTEVIKETKLETEVQVEVTPEPAQPAVEAEEQIPEEPFQALFFEVAGLVLAVPLQELGGIHNLSEVNSLFGKPEWFKGVMLNREKKLNVVDSARWVMPEKFDQQMEQSLEYKYLITLGKSEWGLAAEKLVETESIHPDAVKWRSKPGKRPWLYGTIKEKMCALLHVSDLIAMLEQGINARQE